MSEGPAERSAIRARTPLEEAGGYGDDGLSSLDRRIKELNHQGYSSRGISRVLKSDPEAQGPYGEGWGIGFSAVHERLKEMRLDPRNEIRVNFARTGGKRREEQRWYKIIEILKKETEQYTRYFGFKPMVRTMFYQMRDEGHVKDDEYKAFVEAATDARIGYVDQEGKLLLPRLPVDCFEDDSRESIDDYEDFEPEEMLPPSDIPDYDDYIDEIIEDTKKAPANYEGAGIAGVDGKVGGFWFGQPEYVESWVEKIGLTKGLRKILKDVHVTIKGNKGYSSLAFLHKCTQELKDLINAKGFEVSDVTILYNGDWDPSGENIDYYLQRRLRQLGLEGINFVRVGITPEQIDKYHFPLLPVEKSPEKSRPNPNMAEFIRRYGYKATHINAFFTKKYLLTFKKIIVAEVKKHWYQEIYDVMEEAYDVKAPPAEEYTDESMKEIRQEMYQKITEAFKPGWYKGLEDAPDGDEDGGR